MFVSVCVVVSPKHCNVDCAGFGFGPLSGPHNTVTIMAVGFLPMLPDRTCPNASGRSYSTRCTRTGQKQVVAQLEILAVLLWLLSFGQDLRGSFVRLWIDNVAAQWAIIKGYSGNVFMARAAAEIRLLMVALDIQVFVERVASADDPAD